MQKMGEIPPSLAQLFLSTGIRNYLSVHLKSCESKNIFRKKLKNFLIECYEFGVIVNDHLEQVKTINCWRANKLFHGIINNQSSVEPKLVEQSFQYFLFEGRPLESPLSQFSENPRLLKTKTEWNDVRNPQATLLVASRLLRRKAISITPDHIKAS